MTPQVFRLSDGAGMTLSVMDLGAAWLSCQVPLGDGSVREVVLGHKEPADYLHDPGYRGVIVGRYANRIANARFVLDERAYQLTPNDGPHQLHGGPDGFHRRRWEVAEASERRVRLALDSPDGDQGFPGAFYVEVAYEVTAPGTLTITNDAVVSAPCPVNITSHAYFNLDGAHSDVREHRVRIAADRYLPVDQTLIPTGELAAVHGAFDLRTLRPLGDARFDHCFVLDGTQPAVALLSSDGRLAMTLETDYPGLQVYSGDQAGLALEAQYFPDSPNRPSWPDCVLRPGRRRRHFVRFAFRAA
jgi:aldose 1-epimerase